MSRPRQVRFNAFNMAAPGHTWAGLWAHPRDRAIAYNSLDYWVELARIAERGLFDGIFIADVFGLYDVYGGSPDAALLSGAQVPQIDPALVVPTMAHATRHIGFGVTTNLTYEHPYQFARRFATLDHLTNGRVGWNIVTGYLDSGARGMGQTANRSHDLRYEAAEDFLAATYKLWEASWQDGAVLRDRDARIFSDPALVHRIHHDGPFYQVDGIQLAEPSPQRTPVLYQAGTSGRGRLFAAKHSEGIFLNGQTRPILAEAVRAVRQAAAGFGRDPYDIRMFAGATVIVAPTRAEAFDRLADYAQYVHTAGQLALLSGWTGVDLSTLDPEEAISYVKSNAIQSTLENLTLRSPEPLKVKDLATLSATGARAPFIVGAPGEVADEIVSWVRDTDVDGFNLSRLVSHETLEAFVDLVVPELQDRGVYKTAYEAGTLREKLFPGRGPTLPDSHPAAGFRGTGGAAELPRPRVARA
ncbi:LLM class flavin-dependent oxidoreductase [Xanthobacter agilis]|uniref:FMN-dependent oxidoreductase (Nitrilotriacetate monooxygenase family) n=1 Tax=Xanthobacter agilis TaxID=47492 RepID=A0ABU0LID5_XANAG|nr:LLM class flavin-dependent oxidoreductase [Xanthobacter agilis]MDQ0506904.1 FMN-dependent oxidoreductase (nitrilotriacetate monooxygenase family) [Xanthobacter agilis]